MSWRRHVQSGDESGSASDEDFQRIHLVALRSAGANAWPSAHELPIWFDLSARDPLAEDVRIINIAPIKGDE